MRQVCFTPWRELDRLHTEVNRLFRGRQLPWTFRGAGPAVNLWHNDNGAIVTTELPGVSPEALDLTITRNAVTIRGERTEDKVEGEANWVRRERPETAFHRTVELPVEIDPQTAEATYEKGVLTIKLTRPAEQRPTKLAVRRG